jgi:hypothetical protein
MSSVGCLGGSLILLLILVCVIIALRGEKSRPEDRPAFKLTEVDHNAAAWDRKSCPECGSTDLILLDDSFQSCDSTTTVTHTANIRNSAGEVTGSLEYDQEAPATVYHFDKHFRCGFCLYEFRHEHKFSLQQSGAN